MWKKNPAIKKNKCPASLGPHQTARVHRQASHIVAGTRCMYSCYIELFRRVSNLRWKTVGSKIPITLLETVNFQGYMYVRVCMRRDASTHSTAQNTAHGSGFNQRHWRLRDELMRYIRLYVVQRVGTSDISGHHLPVWRSHCNHEFSLVASY